MNCYSIKLKLIFLLLKIDKAIENEGTVLKVDLPAGRVVYVPVSLNLDYDDVRSFGEAAKKAVLR